MALVTVSGEPGAPHEEIARLAAQRLDFELITESRLRNLLVTEFGAEAAIPDKAYGAAVASILARLATEHHLVVSVAGAELLFPHLPGLLRAHIVAPESRRIGFLMLDHRLDRARARMLLRQLEAQDKALRRARFGRSTFRPDRVDLVLNSEQWDSEHAAVLLETAVRVRGLIEQGHFSAAGEAQFQFSLRMQLARHGIAPAGKVAMRKKPAFGHPSEEIFAHLLDFYRIAWEYEPKSFPVQWDKDGRVSEMFTPDFYLPEFDLYLELTTMKQAHVTRKNRKVKLLREIYPHVNIQVFYQKDIQNLVFKYGLAERPVEAGVK